MMNFLWNGLWVVTLLGIAMGSAVAEEATVGGKVKLPEGGPANAAQADSEGPDTYAGRTLEEWGRLVVRDLDPKTRAEGIVALVTFARNGREADAIAALEKALQRQTRFLELFGAYQKIATLGKPGEQMYIRGLNNGTREQMLAIFQCLQQGTLPVTSEALVAATVARVNDPATTSDVRARAFLAIGYQLGSIPFRPGDKEEQLREFPNLTNTLDQVIPLMEKMLADDDPRTSNAAAVGLVRLSVRRPKILVGVLDYLDRELKQTREVKVSPKERAETAFMVTTNGILSEMYQLTRGPRGRRTLKASIGHLRTMRDVHTKDQILRLIVQTIDPGGEPGPGGRPQFKGLQEADE